MEEWDENLGRCLPSRTYDDWLLFEQRTTTSNVASPLFDRSLLWLTQIPAGVAGRENLWPPTTTHQAVPDVCNEPTSRIPDPLQTATNALPQLTTRAAFHLFPPAKEADFWELKKTNNTTRSLANNATAVPPNASNGAFAVEQAIRRAVGFRVRHLGS